MNNEIEFLKESNAIEKEYSEEALEDAEHAWEFAKKHDHVINIEYIRTIHKELMKRLNPKIAGKIRTIPVYVNGEECLDSSKIINVLKEWLKRANIKFLQTPKDLVVKEIKDIHVEFEKIHPFEDGNGRVGRILMNRLCTKTRFCT